MTPADAKAAAITIMGAGMRDACESAVAQALENGLAAAVVAIEGTTVAVTVTLTRATTDSMVGWLASRHPVQSREVIDE